MKKQIICSFLVIGLFLSSATCVFADTSNSNSLPPNQSNTITIPIEIIQSTSNNSGELMLRNATMTYNPMQRGSRTLGADACDPSSGVVVFHFDFTASTIIDNAGLEKFVHPQSPSATLTKKNANYTNHAASGSTSSNIRFDFSLSAKKNGNPLNRTGFFFFNGSTIVLVGI